MDASPLGCPDRTGGSGSIDNMVLFSGDGEGLAATCSTTECCCCPILSVTSAAFAAAFLGFSGALLLNNMSTSAFAGMQCRKGQKAVVSRPAQAENSQVRMPFENRTAQTRTATTMEPTIASHSVYGAVSGISFPSDSRIAPSLRP